jgi:hypothetical protein
MGWEFVNVVAGAAQNMTWAQVEMMPLSGTTDPDPVPSAYDPSRSIHVTVKPTRLNYCPNPSFEVSTAGWYGVGDTPTLTQDSTVFFPLGGEWDGQALGINYYSCRVNVPGGTGAGGIAISIPDLNTGYYYTASAQVMPGAGLQDLSLTAASSASAPVNTSTEGAALSTTTWYEPVVTFQAPASTVTLTLQGIPQGSGAFEFWVDLVLVEVGDIAGSYFDGDFSNPDYQWEAGQTVGLSRSYYYENYAIQQATIVDIMNEHIPLGITYSLPLYGVPPSQ